MASNLDIAVMAKKVYELSTLSPEQLEAKKWEAVLILNAVISSATQDGIANMNADKEARWGDQIRKEGILSAIHPKWFLRSDDGKPPIIKIALESALDNPSRDLRVRLQALLMVPPDEREPLTDLVRALNADAWDGALSEARLEYSDVMRSIDKYWTKNPWLTVLPHDGSSPILLLIDNQGIINDGSMWDKDPSDDPLLATAWDNAIRTWDIDFLRDNPLAQFYLKTEEVASGAVDAATTAAGTAAEAAKAANSLVLGLTKAIQYWPYAACGVAALAVIVATRD
jgi:hypothetical protein